MSGFTTWLKEGQLNILTKKTLRLIDHNIGIEIIMQNNVKKSVWHVVFEFWALSLAKIIYVKNRITEGWNSMREKKGDVLKVFFWAQNKGMVGK